MVSLTRYIVPLLFIIGLSKCEGFMKSDSFVFRDQPSSTNYRVPWLMLNKHRFGGLRKEGRPPCARGGDTFCEAVDDYPSEHVVRLLKKQPGFIKKFFQDEQKYSNRRYGENFINLIDSSDENPLCPSQEVTVYPKMAKNSDGNWMFVINQDEYAQGVRIEKCINNHACSFPGSLSNGYRSECKQKYIYRKLVALHGNSREMVSDSFEFPSCCSCIIKLDRNFFSYGFWRGN